MVPSTAWFMKQSRQTSDQTFRQYRSAKAIECPWATVHEPEQELGRQQPNIYDGQHIQNNYVWKIFTINCTSSFDLTQLIDRF